MNNIDAYIEDLNSEVELRRDEHPLPVMAFTAYVTDEIASLTNVNEHFVVHCIKKDKAGKTQGEIHGYGISENEEVLTLYYSVYSTEKTSSLLRADFDKAINRLQGFYNYAIRGAHMDVEEDSSEYEVFKFIYDHQSGIMTIRLCVLSNCSISDYDIRDIRIDGKNVGHDIWDIKKIYANLHSGSDHVAIDLDFEDDYSNYQLPYIEMNSDAYDYKCISTMFPAKLLYNLYDKYNTDLLAGNVRYFLKYKGKKDSNANIGIRQTLKTENEMFLAYNNGITAIAKGIEVSTFEKDTRIDSGGEEGGRHINDYISTGVIKRLEDFRIVNGGQTTACIFDTKKSDKKNVNLLGVYVMVKIIITKNSNSDFIGKVIRYTNSQSRIKPSDFSSGNKFNIAFEELSRSVNIPNENNRPLYWFFERIRGQYDLEKNKGKTKVEREYFISCHPKDKRFKKEALAKVWVCWEQKPHEAVKGESTTYNYFMDKKVESGFIPDEQYYKKSIALMILYSFIYNRRETKDFNNGRAPLTAYVVSYLSMFTNGYLDLEKIWKNQELSPEMKTFINKLCGGVQEQLSSGAEAIGKSVLSYSKRKDAFETIKDMDFGCRIETIKDDLI